MKKFFILILFVSLALSSVGLTYLLFLQIVYPMLVPSYGGGETISINSYNNYTFQLFLERYAPQDNPPRPEPIIIAS